MYGRNDSTNLRPTYVSLQGWQRSKRTAGSTSSSRTSYTAGLAPQRWHFISDGVRKWVAGDTHGCYPPNGSRLSCGRPACRRKVAGRPSVPARAQHSVSFRAITARQLQALVRRLPSEPMSGTEAIAAQRDTRPRRPHAGATDAERERKEAGDSTLRFPQDVQRPSASSAC